MTSTNGTTSTNRKVRSLALTLAAAGVATAATAALSLGPTTAQADPGDTYLPIGSSQLLQSEDLESLQVKLNTESVKLNRDPGVGACFGENNPWRGVLKGSPKPITATWTNPRHKEQVLYEHIAQAPTVAKAKAYYRQLLTGGIKDCVGNKSPWDAHYGPVQSSGVGSGYAAWAVFYRGDDKKPSGGVAVIRKGTNIGFVELFGTWGPSDQTMEGVSKEATDRLADVG